MTWNKVISNVVLSAFSVCFLLIFGIYNGYPLVYSDSGAYIASGFDNHVPIDRPFPYCFFIRHTSLYESLWLPVIAQSIVVFYIVYLNVKYLTNNRNTLLKTTLFILILSLTTGISYYSSQIMPDIFSAVFILCLALLLSGKTLLKRDKTISIFVLVFSVIAHNSNIITLLFLTIFYFLFSLLIKIVNWKWEQNKKKIIGRNKILVSLTVFCWLLLPSVHFLWGGGFTVSQSSHIFIMGRLVETGVLSEYLKENCEKTPNSLCSQINKLDIKSWEFEWEPYSPLYDSICMQKGEKNCWLVKKDEYEKIIYDIFTTPSLVFKFVKTNISDIAKQLCSFDNVELTPMLEGSPVLGNIEWRFKKELDQYKSSRQSRKKLDFDWLNVLQKWTIIGSALTLMIIVGFTSFSSKRSIISWGIFGTVLIFLNSVVCVTFSCVDDRFNGRVIWIIPFMLLIVLAGYKNSEQKIIHH